MLDTSSRVFLLLVGRNQEEEGNGDNPFCGLEGETKAAALAENTKQLVAQQPIAIRR